MRLLPRAFLKELRFYVHAHPSDRFMCDLYIQAKEGADIPEDQLRKAVELLSRPD